MEAALTFPLGYAEYWLAVWACALLTAALCAWRRNWRQALGVGLMVVPLWMVLWSFLNSIPALQDPTTVLRPATPERLSRMYYRSLLTKVGYLGAGFLLWSHGRSSLAGARVADLARCLREAGLPMGDRSEGRSAWLGYVGLPLLLAGAWGSQWLFLRAAPNLVTGDSSLLWSHMTPYHAVMISLAAGFGEELLYRGLLLILVATGLRRLGLRPTVAAALAVVGQAVVFGAAHGGYGNWLHVIQAGLFGLMAGFVAWRLGIWAAIVLHVQVDLYIFGAQLAPAHPWATPVLLGMLTLNVLVAIGWGLHLALRGRGGRPVAEPPQDAGADGGERSAQGEI